MSLIYKQAESLIKPLETDNTSSPNGVYVRQNIKEVAYKESDGTDKTKFTYDEAFLTAKEYENYTLTQSITAAIEIKHEGDIIDAYTLTLIEEGVL